MSARKIPIRTLRSDAIKTGPDRAPARAMLRATGLDDAALAKPMVAIVHLSLIHISEPTRPSHISRMPSSA